MKLLLKSTLAGVEVWKKAVAFPISAEAQFGMLNGLRFKILHYSIAFRAPTGRDVA